MVKTYMIDVLYSKVAATWRVTLMKASSPWSLTFYFLEKITITFYKFPISFQILQLLPYLPFLAKAKVYPE